MPGDGLAFPVGVGGKDEFVGVLQQVLQFPNFGLTVGINDVEGSEVVVNIDAGAGPLFFLELGGNIGGAGREIADMTDGCGHNIAFTQIILDLLGLRCRFDNHQMVLACCLCCH